MGETKSYDKNDTSNLCLNLRRFVSMEYNLSKDLKNFVEMGQRIQLASIARLTSGKEKLT